MARMLAWNNTEICTSPQSESNLLFTELQKLSWRLSRGCLWWIESILLAILDLCNIAPWHETKKAHKGSPPSETSLKPCACFFFEFCTVEVHKRAFWIYESSCWNCTRGCLQRSPGRLQRSRECLWIQAFKHPRDNLNLEVALWTCAFYHNRRIDAQPQQQQQQAQDWNNKKDRRPLSLSGTFSSSTAFKQWKGHRFPNFNTIHKLKGWDWRISAVRRLPQKAPSVRVRHTVTIDEIGAFITLCQMIKKHSL